MIMKYAALYLAVSKLEVPEAGAQFHSEEMKQIQKQV